MLLHHWRENERSEEVGKEIKMGAFIAKQPNGLYCRFSTIVDCPTHYNMAAEEYIKLYSRRAEDEARDILENHLKPFEWVEENFVPNNMTEEEFQEILKEMRTDVK